MNRKILALIAALLCSINAAKADFAFTVGSGQTGFSFTASTGGTAICAASVTHCFASVPINTAGAAIFTVAVPGQVTVTNANANGSAVSANSSPVVIASDQVAVAIKAASGVFASGSFASGALASGSVASGAIASGAVASGAYASGSLASGAVVDITNMSVATGAAPPSKAIYDGGLGSGATGGLVRANIICDLHAIYTGSDNGSKTLVAGVSGRKTYICGFLLSTGASATTLTLFKGTDADCATSGAAIGPPYALLANDRVGANSAFWNGFVTATNADYVCINAGAGNAHTAEMWYAIL